MNHLQPFDSCLVCGSRHACILASREELEEQIRYRDSLFRRSLPDMPEQMLADLTVFTNAYAAQLVACEDCGLVCRDPRFTPQASVQAYAQDDYGPEWLEQTFENYYAAFRSRMPELAKWVGPTARVLEVGSYVGGFLAAARDYGWQVQGVDVGRRVSEFARSRGLDVFTGTLGQAQLEPHSFDAIFIWVCFDQLPDPWAELQEIRRLLKKRGWLYLQVPNGDFIGLLQRLTHTLHTPIVREHAFKLLAYTGLAGFPYQVGYTPSTLRRMLSASGFEEIEIRSEINICDRAGSKSLERISEQRRYVLGMYRVGQVIQTASLGRVAQGPWIEASCRS